MQGTPAGLFFQPHKLPEIDNKEVKRDNRIMPVKDDPEFQRIAVENQWKTREARGLSRQTSIFDFLSTVYQAWLGHGMNQADLLAVDKSAWTALQNRLRKEELPGSLPLPKKSDTYINNIADPEVRQERLRARELNRDRMRIMYRLDRR
jgi:hypothetical protein